MAVDAPRPGLRERQRQETHRAIRAAAFDLVVAQGIGAVSVQSICTAAGVSPRTFFNHFRSKDEALLPDFPDFDPAAEAAFLAGDEPDLLAALQQLLTGYTVRLHEQGDRTTGPTAMRQLLEANPELLSRVMAIFEAHERRLADLVGRRTGRPAGDMFCGVVSLTATALMRAVLSAATEPRDGAGEPGSGDAVTDHGACSAASLNHALAEAFSSIRRLAGSGDRAH